MKIVGTDGSSLGIVERFEIDKTGQLTHLVARVDGADLRKRIPAAHITEMRASGVVVDVGIAEFRALPELAPASAPVLLDESRVRLSA